METHTNQLAPTTMVGASTKLITVANIFSVNVIFFWVGLNFSLSILRGLVTATIARCATGWIKKLKCQISNRFSGGPAHLQSM